jgi:hypothetical protein
MTSPMNVPTQNKNKSISHSPPLNVRNQQLVIKEKKNKKTQQIQTLAMNLHE